MMTQSYYVYYEGFMNKIKIIMVIIMRFKVVIQTDSETSESLLCIEVVKGKNKGRKEIFFIDFIDYPSLESDNSLAI